MYIHASFDIICFVEKFHKLIDIRQLVIPSLHGHFILHINIVTSQHGQTDNKIAWENGEVNLCTALKVHNVLYVSTNKLVAWCVRVGRRQHLFYRCQTDPMFTSKHVDFRLSKSPLRSTQRVEKQH